MTELLQGTDAWLQARSGKVTASRIADLCSKLKSGKGESAGRRNYRAQIVCELLTGMPQGGDYVSPAMQRGTELEPLARVEYEIKAGCTVEQIGFVRHGEIERAGCSPDGTIGARGLCEIKCPNPATHIDYLLGKVPPAEYIPQMAWQMACTGRQWVDFVSYCPDLPESLQLFVVRLERDDTRILEITAEVIQFLSEVDAMIAKLQEVGR